MVLTLMDKQAGREVATAEVFGQCVIRPVMARCRLSFPGREELPIELPPQVDLSVPGL